MKITSVKAVDAEETKSIQEVEQELVDQHEEQLKKETTEETVEETVEEEVQEEEQEETPYEIKDEDVLSYFEKKYGKKYDELEDVWKPIEKEVELPEDVDAFYKYKQETGRSMEDYVALNRDLDSIPDNKLIADYIKSQEPELDSEDIEYLMSQKFSYDEELDDDSDIKGKKLAFKRELAQAKKFFESEKEKYKAPIESRGEVPTGPSEEELKAQQEHQALQQQMSETFTSKTEEVFKDFKGFDFTIGDQTLTFKPGEADDIKSAQSDLTNFVSKYLDEKGFIKDAAGYHRALAMAMNPEKMAQFFYEKGKADGVGDISRESKNVNLKGTPQVQSKSTFSVKALNADDDVQYKIRKR